MPWIVGALGGFVLAMVIVFTSRKKVRPALIFAYAAFEGIFVGSISAFFEVQWAGIVIQATLATVAVVVAGLDEYGVDVLGEVPAGPPTLTWPVISFST